MHKRAIKKRFRFQDDHTYYFCMFLYLQKIGSHLLNNVMNNNIFNSDVGITRCVEFVFYYTFMCLVCLCKNNRF